MDTTNEAVSLNFLIFRYGDAIDCFGALHSLQEQCNCSIHVGVRSALSLQGKSHYLEFSARNHIIFV